MKSKQIFFYGLKDDMLNIIKHIESNFNIKYASVGLKDEIHSCFNTLLEKIDDMDNIEYGDWNQNDKYLILPKNQELKIRSVPQRGGGVKYAIDQMINKNSIVFYLGGKFENKAIIASKIAAIYDEEFSINTFNFFSKQIKKEFKKINEFYVGVQALKESGNGLRLTTNINSPIEYDLKINH